MSGSINKCILVCNLCADVEVRTFQSGGKVANLRVATNETWKDKTTGERREKAEYHTVAIFTEGLVRVAEQYLRKGSKVYLEGKLQTRKWQDQSGADKYSTEIVLQGFDAKLVMLDGPSGDREAAQRDEPHGDGYSAGGRPSSMDDEIPFAPCVLI